MEAPHLPVIDISPFLAIDQSTPEVQSRKLQVAKSLDEACATVGFFYVKGHHIDQAVLDEAHHLGKRFFDMGEAAKQSIAITNPQGGGVRGYQRLGENVTLAKRDWHEGIDIYRELDAENAARVGTPRNKTEENFFFGRNQWPAEPQEFKGRFLEYIELMKKLGTAIMRAMALGLGLEENFFDQYIGDSYWVMRIIGYPQLSSEQGVGISCGEHCDYGCLTIVNQDSTKGALQVRSTSGDWVNADPIPGHFVMNIGDMVRVWTNGRYQSTLHRVIHTEGSYRMSIPFFLEPNYDARIEPLPELLRDETPKFEGVRYDDHLLSKVSRNFDFNADGVQSGSRDRYATP